MKSTLMKVNEHLAPKLRGKATAYLLLYKSAHITIVMSTIYRKKLFICHFVRSGLEGHHHATKAFQEAEAWAHELGCKEVWYCTPLNIKVVMILSKLRWKYHEKLSYERRFKEYVNGFSKVLK